MALAALVLTSVSQRPATKNQNNDHNQATSILNSELKSALNPSKYFASDRIVQGQLRGVGNRHSSADHGKENNDDDMLSNAVRNAAARAAGSSTVVSVARVSLVLRFVTF